MNFHYEKLARELIAFYKTNRQVGHTTAMLEGAKNTEAIVIASTLAQAQVLVMAGIPQTRIMGISQVDLALRGRRGPLLIDHYALTEILSGLLEEHTQLREQLQSVATLAHNLASER